ncbi:hypothetical protein SAMN05428963_103392 [Consotaella salsifontis]|uniref:Uncharacterized protein n=1 Tax=Consotaella salsifontis TaxID=1365950 RepID=A0A1T4P938_9HYPH|nr:hypothetical protein SAMN05428963_103392 [Consotaella salsifontis]
MDQNFKEHTHIRSVWMSWLLFLGIIVVIFGGVVLLKLG